MMGLQLLQFNLGGGSGHPRSSSLLLLPPLTLHWCTTVDGSLHPCRRSSPASAQPTSSRAPFTRLYLRKKSAGVSLVGKEDKQLRTSIDSTGDADSEDLENVRQIQRVCVDLLFLCLWWPVEIHDNNRCLLFVFSSFRCWRS